MISGQGIDAELEMPCYELDLYQFHQDNPERADFKRTYFISQEVCELKILPVEPLSKDEANETYNNDDLKKGKYAYVKE